MNVVHVCPRYAPHTGGVETHVQEISERLAVRRHNVTVVTADAGEEVARHETRNGVEVRRCRGVAPGGAFHVGPGVYWTIRRLTADVVHVHNYHSLPLLFAALAVDSSTDDTRKIIREYFAELDAPELVLLEEDERRGLAPALNDAYEAASNEMAVKTDCDSKLLPDVLREAAANLADDDVAAVTGRNVEVLGGSEVESGYRGVQSHIQQLESHLDSTLIFHGSFSAFENDALLPIDPNSLADDTELALKIRRQGGRVIFDPAVQYMEASFSDFVKRRKQKDRRGMGLIRLLVQHRDALGKYGKYGKVVLPFNWWFMILSPWLLAATLVVGTVGAVSVFGAGGLVLPAAVAAFAYLGQKDVLGPVQALYSIFDTQVSLLRASVELLRGKGDGMWEVDAELREAFE